MKIGIDLDGVGYAWDKTARFLIEHYWNIKIAEPTTHWDTLQKNVPSHVWDWLWGAGVKKGLYRHGHMLKGFKAAMDELSCIPGIRLAVVSARPKNAHSDTIDWLAFNKIPVSEIHILGKEPKSIVPCDVYIDDGPHNLEEIEKNRPLSRLVSWAQPYNPFIPLNGIVTKDWQTAINYIRNEKV